MPCLAVEDPVTTDGGGPVMNSDHLDCLAPWWVCTDLAGMVTNRAFTGRNRPRSGLTKQGLTAMRDRGELGAAWSSADLKRGPAARPDITSRARQASPTTTILPWASLASITRCASRISSKICLASAIRWERRGPSNSTRSAEFL